MTLRISMLTALAAIGLTHANTITLTGTVRDFAGAPYANGHPDFENACCGDDHGVVTSTLGADGNPVYANPSGTTWSTHGQAAFDQWFNDAPGVNVTSSYSITLDNTANPDVYTYYNSAFFPVDATPSFGEPLPYGHNYGFTYELNTTFSYAAGQVFTFSGDDDVWVYINNGLVIDLGGVHGEESQSVNLDLLGLTAGDNYTMNVFFAERHTSGSNFRIETNIASIQTQPEAVPEPGSLALFGLGMAGVAAACLRRKI